MSLPEDRSPPGGAGFEGKTPGRVSQQNQLTTRSARAPSFRTSSSLLPIDLVLGRVDRPRRSGRGWAARCPAHDDRSPSLAIAQADDGRVLLLCFAGCAPESIVTALGLRMADLFVSRPAVRMSPVERAEWRGRLLDAHRAASIRGVLSELMIVWVACEQVRKGASLNEDGCARVAAAYDRIAAAMEVFRGR